MGVLGSRLGAKGPLGESFYNGAVNIQSDKSPQKKGQIAPKKEKKIKQRNLNKVKYNIASKGMQNDYNGNQNDSEIAQSNYIMISEIQNNLKEDKLQQKASKRLKQNISSLQKGCTEQNSQKLQIHRKRLQRESE